MIESELIFLGTGTSQGVPAIGSNSPVAKSTNPKDKRLRTSALIKVASSNIVIDCGPDFRFQMLRENVDNLSAILLTHKHSDHIAGLDDIRPLYFKRNAPFPVFCNLETMDAIKGRFDYFFEENKYPGAPSIEENIIDSDDFYVNDVKIQILNLKHAELDVLGFRIGSLAYITDANYISNEAFDKLKGIETLVINSLRFEKHHSHFNVEQALKVIEKISPKHAYLTHIGERMGFHDEVEKQLPENVHLAYDGLKIKFSSF